MSDEKVLRASGLLRGQQPPDEVCFLKISMTADNRVDIWMADRFANQMTGLFAGELVNMLRDFLGYFVRKRG